MKRARIAFSAPELQTPSVAPKESVSITCKTHAVSKAFGKTKYKKLLRDKTNGAKITADLEWISFVSCVFAPLKPILFAAFREKWMLLEPKCIKPW
jgi:hypothetical protein